MKILFFLLLPLSALCQRIEFLEGAGINPKHIESIGADAGFVEVWPGPMAIKNGQMIKVHLPDWENITAIDVEVYSSRGKKSATISPKKATAYWFGVKANEPISVYYTVKRRSKKA